MIIYLINFSGSTSSTKPTEYSYNYYPESNFDTKPQSEAEEQTSSSTIQNGIKFLPTDGSVTVRIESQDFDVKLPDDDNDLSDQIKPGIIEQRNVTASDGMETEGTNTAVTPPPSMADFRCVINILVEILIVEDSQCKNRS